MPDSNSDPEKYTIDEMLDRLKSRGDEDGELVTRADGTKAIKVRKRKRRTEQTRDKLKAQNQRMQLIQIAGFIIFMVAILILGGVLILYTNSSNFRENLITKIEEASGSKTKIQQFRMNPATASAAVLEMKWPESHVLNRLEVNSLKAKISPISFVGKVFEGKEIVAASGNLFLTAPNIQNLTSNQTVESGDSMIRFNRFSVTKLNVFFSGAQVWDRMVENVEVSYLPIKISKGGEIRLIQGLLRMKGWPLLALDRSYIQVVEKNLDIKSMRFHIPATQNQKIRDSGSIDLSGVINPMDGGATHQLSVNLDSFQISYLLGNSLGKFFHGKAITKPDENSNSLQFTPGSGQDAILKLNISNSLDSRIGVAQFKFLGQLAIALDDRWYELPFFDNDVKFSMKRSGEMIELENIHMEQHARMALQGSILVKDESGNISGTLKVGIPEIILAASKNPKLDVLFGPVKEGYRWVDLNISGTGVKPLDNFKELYKAATPKMTPDVKSDSNSSGGDSFDGLLEVK